MEKPDIFIEKIKMFMEEILIFSMFMEGF